MTDPRDELLLAITDLLLDPDAWDRADYGPIIKARDALLAERKVTRLFPEDEIASGEEIDEPWR